MELIEPSVLYKNSFIQAVKEYQSAPSQDRRDILDLNVTDLENSFEAYLLKLTSESEGKNTPDEYVPQSTYWLVDKGEFIGRISIRHFLTEFLLNEGGHIGYDIRPSKRNMGYGKKILELSLPIARTLGIHKALITCKETNLGSKKIIEANGGILENEIATGKGEPKRLRYWIQL